MQKITIKSLFLDEIPYKSWVFPGGEVGIKLQKIPQVGDNVLVDARGILSPKDIFELLQICNAFDDRIDITLNLPYIPYARQDRICNEGEAFALEIFAKMLFELPIAKLIVTDPHSKIFHKLFTDNCKKDIHLIIKPQIQITNPLYHKNKYDLVVFPDAGASEKYSVESIRTGLRFPMTHAMNKYRTENGVVYSELSDREKLIFEGKRILVVDDICDGGRTFISLANIISKDTNLKELDLYVTHGIFSNGLSQLFNYYDSIYCHNLMTEDDVVKTLVTIV